MSFLSVTKLFYSMQKFNLGPEKLTHKGPNARASQKKTVETFLELITVALLD